MLLSPVDGVDESHSAGQNQGERRRNMRPGAMLGSGESARNEQDFNSYRFVFLLRTWDTI